MHWGPELKKRAQEGWIWPFWFRWDIHLLSLSEDIGTPSWAFKLVLGLYHWFRSPSPFPNPHSRTFELGVGLTSSFLLSPWPLDLDWIIPLASGSPACRWQMWDFWASLSAWVSFYNQSISQSISQSLTLLLVLLLWRTLTETGSGTGSGSMKQNFRAAFS